MRAVLFRERELDIECLLDRLILLRQKNLLLAQHVRTGVCETHKNRQNLKSLRREAAT